MKYFIVLISIFCAQVFAQTSPELLALAKQFDDVMKKCTKAHELTPAQFDILNKFQLPIDKNVQCALGCVGKEMDILKNDNTLDRTKITNLLKPLIDQCKVRSLDELIKQINEIVDICVPLQKSVGDECTVGNNTYTCLVENAKKNGLIPTKPN